MPDATPTYTIYLLTVWLERSENAGDPHAWRFRLENPKTQERQGFVGIEALVAGLVRMVVENAELQSPGDTA